MANSLPWGNKHKGPEGSHVMATPKDFLKPAGQLLADKRGTVAIIFGMTLPVLVGMAGLGVEAGLWYRTKRAEQTAADAAAIAGALELLHSNKSNMVAAARSDSALNGYPNSSPNTVTVNNPPQSGPNAGQASAVE